MFILKDEIKVNEYVLKALEYIQNNSSLNGVVNKMLLDGELYSHSVNVSRLATQLALSCNLDDATIFNISLSGLLHDIGKINIDKSILYKPAKLTEEEFEIIKKHPLDGSEIVKNCGVATEVTTLILNHHETHDGSGYPNHITNKTLEEDLITIADIYSALTESRVYHKQLSIYEAFIKIQDFKDLNKGLVNMLQDVIE